MSNLEKKGVQWRNMRGKKKESLTKYFTRTTPLQNIISETECSASNKQAVAKNRRWWRPPEIANKHVICLN